MCIAFDGAYILEAPTTQPAATDEYVSGPDLMTNHADSDAAVAAVAPNVAAERPVPLEHAIG